MCVCVCVCACVWVRSWLHTVSAKEEREEAYHIDHVVLPTLGTAAQMPKNKVGEK